jgi:hypothetical protein
MFERFYQWALRRGSRCLFVVAVAMVLISLWQTIVALSAGFQSFWTSIFLVFQALSNAAVPFFFAIVIERIDLWLQRGGTIAVVAPAAVLSRLARWSSHLLLALSLLYFLVTAFICTDLTAVLNGSWLGTLWQGSLLLFASLALDRLDRWLATIRPYSG